MPDGGSTGIGASVKRKEDYRFLVGEGNYTDDINRPNQTYTYMLRSSSAHATFSIDTSIGWIFENKYPLSWYKEETSSPLGL